MRQPINHSAGPTDSGKLAAELILKQVGENPERGGLIDTPERFSKALAELCSGYKRTLQEVVGSGIFAAEGSGLVAVKKIEFFSLCEHHLLPFWGHASIAYYPGKSILGLSKIARVVDLYARRLQVQERLTREIAIGIEQAVSPRAVAVRIEAAHACMMMRGIEKQHSLTATEHFENIDALSSIECERLFHALSAIG